jgi:hypothetical protein
MKQTNSSDSNLDFLSTLTDNQAHLVLIHLLRSHPSLSKEATTIARDLVSGINEEEITDQVCCALSDLDVHQLWDESGRTRDGYVDPNEHSYEMMEEIIYPFLNEMDRFLDREMKEEALAYCRGIIRGVCVYMHDEAGEFADWAVDNEDGLTYDVIERWKSKLPDVDLLRDLELFREECLAADNT